MKNEADIARDRQARIAQAAADLLDISIADSPANCPPEITAANAMAHVFAAATRSGLIKDPTDVVAAAAIVLRGMTVQIAEARKMSQTEVFNAVIFGASRCPIEIRCYPEPNDLGPKA